MTSKAVVYRRINSFQSDNISLDIENNSNIDLITNDNNTEVSTNEKRLAMRLRSYLIVPALVLLWYSMAVIAITTSKSIMIHIPLPFLLCCSQFAMASVLTTIYIESYGNIKSLQSSYSYLVYQIATSYTFGFIFTNIAFSLVNASFAETVKAGEPLSTVLLGILYLKEESSNLTYLTLLPICSGVAISCLHDDSFHINGFVFAVLSNFCFSIRAVIAKRLHIHYSGYIDEITLFYYISTIGLFILIPLMLIFEGKQLLNIFVYNFQYQLVITLSLMVINSFAYTIYNVTSFLVLSKTNLITHAVLNVFRRVFIILYTTYFFQVKMSILNCFGILIAVIGVLSFAYAKSLDNANKP